ncbi:MAG: EthD family reductase, partial [Gemmatimonadales bacterium]|nr:EthD family reductase [Gemmatimonadales bacterium]
EGPMAIVTVIYNTPKDTAAFEKYYRDVHLPLLTANQQEIGREPMAIATVIDKQPKDSVAFEKYYAETHLPLLGANQQEIGFNKAELTKFESNLDGSAPARYRQAELYFPSLAALKKGTATPGFKKVAGDLPNFATGGVEALVAVETR